MGLETPKFEVRHGGEDLHLSEMQLQDLFDAYNEQFVRQQADGLVTEENILNYIKVVLAQPETVLFFEGEQILGMGGIKYFPHNPAYPNNAITELNTLVVTQAFRGRGFSEEIIQALIGEALNHIQDGQGIIFSLITSNPIVAHQAQKSNFKPQSAEEWAKMTGSRLREGYFEKYGYQAFINEVHRSNDAEVIGRFCARIRFKLSSVLRKLNIF